MSEHVGVLDPLLGRSRWSQQNDKVRPSPNHSPGREGLSVNLSHSSPSSVEPSIAAGGLEPIELGPSSGQS